MSFGYHDTLKVFLNLIKKSLFPNDLHVSAFRILIFVTLKNEL